MFRLLPLTRHTGPGRHTARYFAEHPAPEPPFVPDDPWLRPWTGPTKEQARAIFQRQAEAALRLHPVRQRRHRTLYYISAGVPLPAVVFDAAEVNP
ncbi:hypothetical protein ACIBCM_13825 [Streptomyces sp. NPDC051018]|uniref:hypothetical protein n=1 Tax=Streptomyces sp. NPDC051018 TaxID=3365639 RepID=UPI0037BC2E16